MPVFTLAPVGTQFAMKKTNQGPEETPTLNREQSNGEQARITDSYPSVKSDSYPSVKSDVVHCTKTETVTIVEEKPDDDQAPSDRLKRKTPEEKAVSNTRLNRRRMETADDEYLKSIGAWPIGGRNLVRQPSGRAPCDPFAPAYAYD